MFSVHRKQTDPRRNLKKANDNDKKKARQSTRRPLGTLLPSIIVRQNIRRNPLGQENMKNLDRFSTIQRRVCQCISVVATKS